MKKYIILVAITLSASSVLNARRSCYDIFSNDYNNALLAYTNIQQNVWNIDFSGALGAWTGSRGLTSAISIYGLDKNSLSILSNASTIYNITLDNISTNYWNCVCSSGGCG